MATLLGLTNGALFFCVYAGVDYTTGYTYYLFLQRDGDVTVVNASIKIYVDPDGYTAALTLSPKAASIYCRPRSCALVQALVSGG